MKIADIDGVLLDYLVVASVVEGLPGQQALVWRHKVTGVRTAVLRAGSRYIPISPSTVWEDARPIAKHAGISIEDRWNDAAHEMQVYAYDKDQPSLAQWGKNAGEAVARAYLAGKYESEDLTEAQMLMLGVDDTARNSVLTGEVCNRNT